MQEWMVRSMNNMAMKYEDWLRGCVHHDGRKGNVYLPCDSVLAIADWIEAHRDVAPVRHGKWINEQWTKDPVLIGVTCSNCMIVEDRFYKYCPNCGAKMDKGE